MTADEGEPMTSRGATTDPAAALAELAELPEYNPGPVCRLDRDGTIGLANAAARRLFGDSDLRGRRWDDLCPTMNQETWERVLGSRIPVSCEVEVGGRCVIFTCVRSDTGRSVFVYGTDITERKRAERQLAEQAGALAEVARFPDMNPGPVVRLDLGGTILLANRAARRVFGDDLVGRSWLAVCPSLDIAAWRRILATTDIVPLEARIGDCEYIFTHRRDPQSDLVFTFGTDVTRQRRTERALRQSEKMATLGTLAAGVAHELNNPAAATRRAAEQLREVFGRLEEAQLRLAAMSHTEAGWNLLRSLKERGRSRATQPEDLDALARSDREAEVEAWLVERGVHEPWDLAPLLVRLGLDTAALSTLAAVLEGETLPVALGWAAGVFHVQTLLYEIGQGTARLSEIVGALKNYSYVGQAPAQLVDLHEGLDNTLIILRNKLKTGITVRREYGADVPTVMANGGELNQVWTNVLDNAADAMAGKGTITIRTRRQANDVLVEIEDDGPGIPEAAQGRIFDPFFTTKAPGKGTGLGLSTSYTIVTENHKGSISVESRPGSTRFSITLPIGSRP